MKFFVYGTLKVGGYFASQVDEFRKKHVTAKIMGTMFSIDNRYPGVVLDGGGEIHGEVHEYDEEARVERILDRIEGHDAPGSPRNLYEKETTKATLEDGSEIDVVVYTFARNTAGYKKISNGIWEI